MIRVLNFMHSPKLAHILVGNDPLDEPNQMPPSKKSTISRSLRSDLVGCDPERQQGLCSRREDLVRFGS